MNNPLKKLVLPSAGAFLFSITSAFAAVDWTSDGLIEFFNDLDWMAWAVYLGSIMIVTMVLSNLIEQKKIAGLKGRQAKFIAFIFAFMSITGFIWTLITSGIIPHYLVLFAGEIFVLAIFGGLWYQTFKANKDKEGFASSVHWLILLISFYFVNSYHSMLTKFGTDFIPVDSILYQLAQSSKTFGELPMGMTIFAGLLLILLALVSNREKDPESFWNKGIVGGEKSEKEKEELKAVDAIKKAHEKRKNFLADIIKLMTANEKERRNN